MFLGSLLGSYLVYDVMNLQHVCNRLDMCMQEDSCPTYMQKAEDALRMEEERVTNYLHVDTKAKLLAEVERELLEHYETELLEKEQSGAAALMRDDKVPPHRAPLFPVISHLLALPTHDKQHSRPEPSVRASLAV